jgi:aspartyl-tRNA(Asn)/glutamyl-tRNA(Gln) amidotransferase subunit A
VTDNALLLNAISGFDEEDPTTFYLRKEEDFTRDLQKPIKGLKVGLPSTFYFENLDPEVDASIKKAIRTLEAFGAEIKEIDLPPIPEFIEAHKTIIRSEAYAVHEQRLKDFPDQWDGEVKERLLTGVEVLGHEFEKALEIKQLAIKVFHQVLSDVDVLFTPSIPILPPKIGNRDMKTDNDAHIRWTLLKLTAPTNLNGFPSITVPCGRSKEGLPIGAQFIGRAFDEATVYRFAYALEQGIQ